jgi:hypothetical protein
VSDDFGARIAAAYASEGAAVELGRGMLGGEIDPEAVVRIPTAMCNRHGLIAGATGTGKTKTLQLLAEQLSAQGVPVFAADIKGDLAGLSQPGEASEKVTSRATELGVKWEPAGFPVTFLSLGGLGPGVPVRATVSAFGPQLLAKVLDANETQSSSLSLVFRYADQAGLALLDLVDLVEVLKFLTSDDGTEIDRESAREKLAARLAQATEPAPEPEPPPAPEPAPRRRRRAADGDSDANPVLDYLTSRQGQAMVKKVTRGVLGMLRKRL